MAGELPPVVAVVRASIADFQAKMGVVKGEMDDVSKSSTGLVSKLSSVGKGVAIMGAASAVAFGAFAVASVVSAAKFQSSMETIHTQAGASQAEVDKMSKAVLNLAGPVATAPDVLAAALYHVESVGLRGAKALGVLKIAAEGAKVGHADLTDVTNALDAAIVSGIPGVQNYAQAMGALNAVVGSGDMTMQDLSDAMSTGVVVVAKQFGLSLNDVGSALATFGDNNIRGAKAGTELRMAIMDLSNQSKAGQAVLAQFGITSGQLGADMRKGGLGLALADLKGKLAAAGITGNKVGQILTEAFTKKSAAPLAILLDQMGRFDNKQKLIAAGANKFGADWSATTQTLGFQFDEAKAYVVAFADKFGMYLIPRLENAAKYLERAIKPYLPDIKQGAKDVQKLGEAFAHVVAGGLKDFVKWIGDAVRFLKEHHTALIAVAGAIAGPLAIALGIYIAQMAIAAAETLIALWPLYLLMAACAAVAVAAYELVTHWHQVWSDIKQWAEDGWKYIQAGLHTLEQTWNTVWGAVKSVVTTVWDAIKPIVTTAVDFIRDYITVQITVIQTVWNVIWDALRGYIQVVWDEIKGIVSVAVDLVKGVISTFLDLVQGKWGQAWNAIVTTVKNIWHDVWTTITGITGTIVSAVSGVASAAIAGFLNVFNGIVNFITTWGGNLAGWIGGVIQTVVGAAVSVGSAIINGIVSGIEAGASWVWNAIIGIVKKIPWIGGSLASALGGDQKASATAFANTPTGLALGFAATHAAGGVFTTPHLGIVAEAGPEAIIPLSNPGAATSIMARAGLGGGGVNINLGGINIAGSADAVTVQMLGQAFQQFANQLAQQFAALDR